MSSSPRIVADGAADSAKADVPIQVEQLEGTLASKETKPSEAKPAAAGGPPDGGLQAWTCVAGSFLMHIAMFGYLYSFGVWILPYSEQFDVGTDYVSVTGSVMFCVWLAVGPIAGAAGDRYGVKATTAFGGLMMAAGLLLASVANQVWQIILAQGALLGIAGAAMYFPGVSVVGQWFAKKRGFATSIATLGAGVGSFAYPVLVSNLIDEHGTRNALRILAALQIGLLIPAILLLRRRLPCDRSRGVNLDWSVMKERNFKMLFLASGLFMMGYNVPVFFLPAYAEKELGYTKVTASLSLTIFGAGNTLGRPLMGMAADKLGPTKTLAGSVFIAGVATLLWPTARDMTSLCIYSFSYGVFGGAWFALIPVVVAEHFGVRRLASILSLVFFGFLPGTIISTPLAGMVFDKTGKFLIPQLVAGAFITVTPLALLRVRKQEAT